MLFLKRKRANKSYTMGHFRPFNLSTLLSKAKIAIVSRYTVIFHGQYAKLSAQQLTKTDFLLLVFAVNGTQIPRLFTISSL